MNSNNNMQSVHCKVSLDDQYRRFLFTYSTPLSGGESMFNKLQNQLRNLYNIIGGELVLKYKDDEGDHIIVGCDEELDCAVAQSAGLLRLVITLKKDQVMTDVTPATATTSTTTTASEPMCMFHGEYGHPGRGRWGHGGRHGYCRHGHGFGHHCHAHDHCEHGHHGHGHGHGHHGGHHGKCHKKYGKNKVEKLTAKREMIAAVLNDPSVKTDEFQKQKLQRKLECIDRRLAIFATERQASVEGGNDETSTSSSSSDDKWRKKKCDKWRKKHGNGKQRRIKKTLSEDEKAALKVLKSQIWELKPAVNAVKIQLSQKKALKADAKAKGDLKSVEELEKEILQLKEIVREHKNAIAPLKQQIFALKFEQC